MTILACHHHDSIELICLFALQVEVKLKDDTKLVATARDTKTTADKREFLLLEQAGKEVQVELIQISSIKAKTENPYFEFVSFE